MRYVSIMLIFLIVLNSGCVKTEFPGAGITPTASAPPSATPTASVSSTSSAPLATPSASTPSPTSPTSTASVLQTPEQSNSMNFGALVDSASYRYPGHWYGSIDEEGSKKEIDAMAEMGIDFFRIDIRNETLSFPEEVEKLDNIVAYGRSKGLKFDVGVFGMETWQGSLLEMQFAHPHGGGGKASWDDFKNMYTYETSYLMNRYKPDYIMIIPEARKNIGNQVNSERTVEEWVAYTKELAAMIKSISPTTKIFLNQMIRSQDKSSSKDYVEGLMKDNDRNIDIIGIDPYSFDELNDEISTSTSLAKQYNWHGNLGVGETNIFNTKGDDYQKEYFENAIDFAEKNNFAVFVIFYFRDIPQTLGERGILRNDFSKKPAYWVILNKTKS